MQKIQIQNNLNINFIIRETLVQSDLVLALLKILSSIKYICIKHSQTLVYMSKYYKFNANI